MSEKFRNKYRISSARLQNWDYGRNAAYFVTICTQNREHYFGNIAAIVETPDSGVSTTTTDPKPTIQLSPIGKLAQKYWMEIPHHFPFVQINVFVVMPNHVHGIIVIDRISDGCPDDAATEKWKPGTLGVIVNQYKRTVTINARKINPDFAWQSGFYDHVIRNDESFERICHYILFNPENWGKDKFNVPPGM